MYQKKKLWLQCPFLEKMNDNRILFVDLDGTLIKEDLSNLAFIDFLKKKPILLFFYLFYLCMLQPVQKSMSILVENVFLW